MLPSDSLDHERLAVKQLQFSCVLTTYLTVLKISPRHSHLMSIGMSIIIKIIIKMRQYYDRAYSARNFASSFSLKCKNTKSKGSYLPSSKKNCLWVKQLTRSCGMIMQHLQKIVRQMYINTRQNVLKLFTLYFISLIFIYGLFF